MRRPHWVKKSGPYKVSSHADGTLTVYPAWPQFQEWTEEDGGGPGLFSRTGLAHDLQNWLNAVYDVAEVAEWVLMNQPKRERRLKRYLKKSSGGKP